MSPLITLTHIDHGPMRVRFAEEHTEYLRERHWVDDDSDGSVYADDAFEETPEQISELFRQARAAA